MKARSIMEKTILQRNSYDVSREYLENRYNKIRNCKNKNTDMERLGRQYCLLYFVYLSLVFQTQNLQHYKVQYKVDVHSIGSPTFSKMVEWGLLPVGHKKPPTLPGGKYDAPPLRPTWYIFFFKLFYILYVNSVFDIFIMIY